MKFAKKSLSMILTVVIVFSVFAICPFTIASAEVNEICPWPGVPMSYVGDSIYAFNVPEEYNLLIFCDGQVHYEGESSAYQTSDLSFPGGNMLYTASKGSIGTNKYGVKVCGGSWSYYNVSSSSNRTVYFKSPWGSASCYCWNYGGTESTMTKLEPVEPSPYIPVKTEQQFDDENSDGEPDISFSLDSGIDFTAPSDVPVIGGKQISIDLASVPLKVDVDGHTVRVGIGFEEKEYDSEGNYDDATWSNWKKEIQESIDDGIEAYDYAKKRQKERRSSKKTNATSSMGMGVKVDTSVAGYFEATYDDDWNVIAAGGRLSGEIKGSAENEWQVIAFSLPIVLKFSGEASVSIDTGLKLDINKSVIFIDNVEVVLPHIRVSAGIGIAHIADVSAYGALTNTVSLNLESLTATISGEAGFSAKALMFEFNWPLFQGEKTYYDSAAKHKAINSFSVQPIDIYNRGNYVINRSYLDKQSNWLYTQSGVTLDKKTIASVGANSEAYTILQSNVYNGALPHLVKTDDVTMMVWCADIPSRTEGNHIATVYSIYDNITDLWSAPVIIDDDGTADSYPKVATDGKDIFVAWTNSSKFFDETVTLEEMSEACEIEIAKYNKRSNSFDCTAITDNNVADILGNIAVKDGNAYVLWSSNSNNDIFQQSGTNTISYAVADGNLHFETFDYVDTSDIIFDLNIGAVNNKVAVVYNSAPLNSDPNSEAVIFAGYLNETPHVLVDGISALTNIQFSDVLGESMVTWAYDQRIFGTTNLTNGRMLTDEDIYVSADYQFVSDGINTMLITNEMLDNRSEIFSYSYVDGQWTNPVVITDNGKYMRGVSALNVDGKLQLAYLLTSANVDANNLSEISNLCVQSIEKNHNLSIDTITYDSNGIIPGGELPVTLQIDNDGSSGESSVNIIVSDENGAIILTQSETVKLGSGESTELKVNVPLPSEITGPKKYNVTVMSSMGYDVDFSDNSKTITFGMADLTLITKEVFSQNAKQHGVLVTVINNNCVDTSAALYIRNTDEFSESLKEFSLGEVKGNSELSYFIDATTINKLLGYASAFSFELVSLKAENSVADNKVIMYLGDFNEHKPSESPSTEPTTTPAFGTAKYIVVGSAELCNSDWNTSDLSNRMTKSGKVYTKTYQNVSPAENLSIKIIENQTDGSVVWYGDENDDSISFGVSSTCDVTVTFNPNTKEITVTGSGVKYYNYTMYDVDSMYAVGNGGSEGWMNGVSWDPSYSKNRMTKIGNGLYRITFENIPKGSSYQMKFAANGNWFLNWGGTYLTDGTATDAICGGANITFSVPYDFATVTATIDIRNFNYYYNQGAKFTLSIEEKVEEPEFVLGDVNLDDMITIDDVTGIQRYIAQLDTFDDTQLFVADVDDDGFITIVDATILQKYLVGLIDSV